MTRARMPKGAAAMLALLALLTGCLALPTTGDVQTGLIRVDDDDETVIDLPEGPAPGATPEEIIEGFIRAGRGPQDRYSVAREYLTEGFAAEWNPTEQVRISSSSIRPEALDEGGYAVTMSVSAVIDGDGRYTQQSSQQTLIFQVVLEDGEYRISSAPAGTTLPPATFQSVFRAYPLYFFDPSFRFLVPDLRWFPVNGSAPNRIVAELLDGPSAWLGSGVLVNAFPEGVELDGNVEIRDGRASVPLSPEVSGEQGATQRRMLQQLRASLSPLGNVTSAQITVDGLTLAVPEGGAQPEVQYQVGVNPIGALDGRFGELTGSGVTRLEGYGQAVDDLQPIAAAVQRDRRSVAVLHPGGVSRVEEGGDPVALDTRAGLVAPTIDPFGFVWSVPAGAPDGMLAFAPDDSPHSVPLHGDGRVIAIEASRDGARLLVALATASGPRLYVAGILRDEDGVPVGLGAPYELPVAVDAIIDVAWADADSVAVLARAGDSTVAELHTVGGGSTSLGPLDGATAIVGGNGPDGLRALGAEGVVLRPGGPAGWPETSVRASFLATQH